MTKLESLIPELKNWNGSAGIDVKSWIGCVGNYQLAIGYSTIFRPRFVAFENYVLREGFSVEGLRECEKSYSFERRTIEGLLNHLHIADIHASADDITKDQVVYLGRTLRDIYRLKLQAQFSDRQFEVIFEGGDFEALHDYQLTFYQV
jgi:hypothetical protein